LVEAKQESDTIKQNAKASLVGTYVVTGTDPDGEAYQRAKTVDISLAPSGALELDWDNGKHVGVGQVVNDVLVVSYSRKSQNVISIMTIKSRRFALATGFAARIAVPKAPRRGRKQRSGENRPARTCSSG
jgi:hypothetical protein